MAIRRAGNPLTLNPPRKKPPGKAVRNWLANWWSELTLYKEAPFVPAALLLKASEEIFDELERRGCDPCMLKTAAEDGSLIFLKRVAKDRYAIAVRGVRVAEKLTLDGARLKIREYLGEDDEAQQELEASLESANLDT